MTITRAHFVRHTGVEPVQDDLERSNCALAGTPGHHQCGWDAEFDLPVFLVGRTPEQRDAFRKNIWPKYAGRLT